MACKFYSTIICKIIRCAIVTDILSLHFVPDRQYSKEIQQIYRSYSHRKFFFLYFSRHLRSVTEIIRLKFSIEAKDKLCDRFWSDKFILKLFKISTWLWQYSMHPIYSILNPLSPNPTQTIQDFWSTVIGGWVSFHTTLGWPNIGKYFSF